MRGYFGIGIYQGKNIHNIGLLWRSAHALGAAFIFNVGPRYRHQSSDTTKAYRHIPMYNLSSVDQLFTVIPKDCMLIGIEQYHKSIQLKSFLHPERAVYILGSEDNGLPPGIMERCQHVVEIPTSICLNVSVAGSIIMYDRISKYKGRR